MARPNMPVNRRSKTNTSWVEEVKKTRKARAQLRSNIQLYQTYLCEIYEKCIAALSGWPDDNHEAEHEQHVAQPPGQSHDNTPFEGAYYPQQPQQRFQYPTHQDMNHHPNGVSYGTYTNMVRN
jgi:hypothetical protein